jgi:hypothetical protein
MSYTETQGFAQDRARVLALIERIATALERIATQAEADADMAQAREDRAEDRAIDERLHGRQI